MPQRVWPTLGSVAPWPTLSLPLPQCIRPTLGGVAPWPMLSLPSPQHVRPTLSSVALRPTLSLPSPQRVWLTLGGVAPRPTRPPSAACQLCRPKPLLALQLPANAAPLQASRASSSPACIANVQERPCVAVAAKSGRQAGHGGGGGKATGRWFGLPLSVMQEQHIQP
jgi:hypothetical protein